MSKKTWVHMLCTNPNMILFATICNMETTTWVT